MTERHVLGISGGKDSAALAIYMRQHYPELNIEYFFTDTGKELPEVYEFLGKLEGFLGKKIEYLNPDRDFDFWLKEYNNFLPSPQTRWCTRQLKLRPFELWVKPMLASGDTVNSYVAIRADEEYREGYASKNKNLKVTLPFRENGIDKAAVGEILEASGVGWPEYYKWRSRSGCTFCFFQQKIEWARLKQYHPEAFEEAKAYEKNAMEHGSPFTWTQGESLSQLERPERIIQIFTDYDQRKARIMAKKSINPLRPVEIEDIDDIYGDDEGNGSCNICHK
ncbi:phosphoadenosine phosphosulfate reductase family protein [Yersinia ruckeri]|jgi:3'-phosphoadenosine 5'-phosphosulfate sulfotransferase (PAPS reductase)/FAD synthetase|uniref:phosphoadenosine phosphosulfate reductase family protein n=1 Tax=Yersinia ruckeri TaxID=29486 RepID=UPI002237EAFC|nr:phosphoadenosine phosphosulfate reductase family protein [Yersinia ruckeri]MCW6541753.1 phosphoadenosine phosphosulfate reductase family protein [Yersinia ruckeri]MCW6590135.1 phosphoadenosine phosphosulfate reductase family protein [Yersinia ruckeri]UZX92174.1 phosphoadenosine phosphosulfate reductase family protein [Yersinia ruckeri]